MPATKRKARKKPRHRKTSGTRRTRNVPRSKMSRACYYHRHRDCSGASDKIGKMGGRLVCRCPCH